jgi:hypothetical protein
MIVRDVDEAAGVALFLWADAQRRLREKLAAREDRPAPKASLTGRLTSSSEPNMMNIPIRTEEGRSIRRALLSHIRRNRVRIGLPEVER